MARKYIFRKLRICDPGSPQHGKMADVLVENGRISRMGSNLAIGEKAVREVVLKNATAYPGFCDLYTDFCDPGYEHREDIITGMEAAAAGGFTTVCTIPRTHPVVQSKSGVEYIRHRALGGAVTVLPLGAVSEDLQGVQPTEMYDMHVAGAAGFTDAPSPVRSSGLLLRALQYVQPFNGVVLDMSADPGLAGDGHLNEGDVSVRMGLKGIPHMAEVIQLKRNIELLRYAGGRLHMYGISTAEGVGLIRAAKKEGLDITASVFVHHLLFTDEQVGGFDTHLKSNPPFRTEADRKALLKGLINGDIDCVATQHTPLEVEEKKTEFEYASPGLTALETAYPVILEAFGDKLPADGLPTWLSRRPREILGLQPAGLSEGRPADFTIADPSGTWDYNRARSRSRSANNPLLGRELTGQVLGIFNNGKWLPNE